jgi:hypothetical protein
MNRSPPLALYSILSPCTAPFPSHWPHCCLSFLCLKFSFLMGPGSVSVPFGLCSSVASAHIGLTLDCISSHCIKTLSSLFPTYFFFVAPPFNQYICISLLAHRLLSSLTRIKSQYQHLCFCSLLHPQSPKQYLVHCRHSNIC